jgi:O-antigen/teichoic acid export membrane protein
VLRRIAGFLMAGTAMQLVGIALGIVQARTLGPEGKSVLAYAAIGLSLVLTATEGLSAAILTQVGRDKKSVNVIHAALQRVAVLVGLPSAVVLLAVGIVLPSQRPLIGAALVIPFAVYVQGVQGILLATGSARALILQGALNSSFYGLLLMPLLIFAHLSAYAALTIWVLGWVGSAVYGFSVCRGLGRMGVVPSTGELRDAMFEQIRRGLKNGAAMFAGYLNLRIDVFLVSAVLGARQLGLYTLAVATGELIWNLSQPVVWSTMDRVAGTSFEDAAALVARLTRNVLIVEIFFALVLAVVAPPLIKLVYGPRFEQSALVLQLLLPGMAIYAVRALMGYFILVRLDRPFFLMMSQSVSALTCAAISLAMFPSFGIAGAATATSVTYCLLVVVQAAVFCRATSTDPAALLIPTREDIRWFERRARGLFRSRFRGTGSL